MKAATFRSAILVAAVALAIVTLGTTTNTGALAQASVSDVTAERVDPKLSLLTSTNSTLLLIDYQSQMILGVNSGDRQSIRNNVEALSKAAKAFDIPTMFTAVSVQSFNGVKIPELTNVFQDHTVYTRTSMNAWDDPRIVSDIERAGRSKLIISALWTEVSLMMPTLEALSDGYQVYIVTDASGGTSKEAHDMAVSRMVQAGAIPVTWQQVMLEWQRDWANTSTYEAVTTIAREHSGAYGVGIDHAYGMFGAKEGQKKDN
ncbi:MAG: hydrolase [Planctomycetota bacterium]